MPLGLVAYSDSEGSDAEVKPAPAPKLTAASKAQKAVDRPNPMKIQLKVPALRADDDVEAEAPPAKKARIGGGAFSGFNSLLPAPKKTATAPAEKEQDTNTTKSMGMSRGFKTSGEAAFDRSALGRDREANALNGAFKIPSASSPPAIPSATVKKDAETVTKPDVPVKRFVPTSVALKQLKKKNKKNKKEAVAMSGPDGTNTRKATKDVSEAANESPVPASVPAKKPKVSLFSTEEEPPAVSRFAGTGKRSSNMYGFEEEDDEELEEAPDDSYAELGMEAPAYTAPVQPQQAQTLDSIASDLNLSESARRQLFGRQRGRKGEAPDLSAIKIVNFNTDQEYAANEELRAAGDTVQHNPVRALAAGKHSLRQLVNAASSQKEALEESFAAGKSNRKEAGSRYGW
ncbi:hypothetical protein K402DRAFT_389176 [Aulographum hederae CBS 113979]|uniref:Mitotic checkpoint regulator, MAD2B-interacting-domain-containing protein n=1 Tax=Aulographum hederae CBS 113979 TaxID=1176131 RepID=A0A6G1HD46_9PEZI|nr:hypothetical protein K402DRAFT_389176 [Aulographum hederae CBS 113979]